MPCQGVNQPIFSLYRHLNLVFVSGSWSLRGVDRLIPWGTSLTRTFHSFRRCATASDTTEAKDSVTRCLDYLFNIWPRTATKLYTNNTNEIFQIEFKICPILNKALGRSNLPQALKIIQSQEISQNLIKMANILTTKS